MLGDVNSVKHLLEDGGTLTPTGHRLVIQVDQKAADFWAALEYRRPTADNGHRYSRLEVEGVRH